MGGGGPKVANVSAGGMPSGISHVIARGGWGVPGTPPPQKKKNLWKYHINFYAIYSSDIAV